MGGGGGAGRNQSHLYIQFGQLGVMWSQYGVWWGWDRFVWTLIKLINLSLVLYNIVQHCSNMKYCFSTSPNYCFNVWVYSIVFIIAKQSSIQNFICISLCQSQKVIVFWWKIYRGKGKLFPYPLEHASNNLVSYIVHNFYCWLKKGNVFTYVSLYIKRISFLLFLFL